MKVKKAESPNLFAAMPAEEFNQAVSGGDIGPDRMRAAAAIVGEI
jgi:hypothetical protein